MKQYFSPKWISSKQPRKQRKYRYNAPLHLRQKMLSVHLDKGLRVIYKKRSLPARVGDEVVVTAGKFRKISGKISKIDMKGLKIYVDSIKRKKVSGQEMEIAIDPSNVMITKLNLDDKRRQKFMKRKGVKEEITTKKDVKETKEAAKEPESTEKEKGSLAA